jgi:hypothetical protein
MVKPQIVIDPNNPTKKFPAIRWMKEGVSYPVFDIYKYTLTDKETGTKKIVTRYLAGDPVAGSMAWVDARVVDFTGE